MKMPRPTVAAAMIKNTTAAEGTIIDRITAPTPTAIQLVGSTIRDLTQFIAFIVHFPSVEDFLKTN
jgi:hypothetical protein